MSESATDDINKLPTITCEWSESPAFEDGKTYSVLEFDTIMKREDSDWRAKREQELEAYGGDINKLYEARDNGELKSHHQGYAKTRFTVNMPDSVSSFSERQDIGDGYGGVIDFLSRYKQYHSAVEILKSAIEYELEHQDTYISSDEVSHDEAPVSDQSRCGEV